MIALVVELLLAGLLAAALMVGLRLEKRLKTLRESQAGFAGAVVELNGAIARAEAGLAELRTAAVEAQVEIADRVRDAKGAGSRIEAMMGPVNAAIERLEAANARAENLRPVVTASRPPLTLHPGESRGPGFLGDRAEQIEKSLGPGFRRDDKVRNGPTVEVRSRQPADDDLFEAPLRMAGGRS
jgi:hypothetical protein